MKYQYLRAFIVLVAGLITLIVNIRTHKEVTVSLWILLGVIVVFYLMATLIIEILQHSITETGQKINDSDEVNEVQDDETQDDEASGNLLEEDE